MDKRLIRLTDFQETKDAVISNILRHKPRENQKKSELFQKELIKEDE